MQKNLIEKKPTFHDFDAENIEKSINYSGVYKENLIKKKKKQEQDEQMLKNKKKLLARVKILESNSFISRASVKDQDQAVISSLNARPKSNTISDELAAYNLDDLKTSPPVGWKRPTSRATLVAKAMLQAKKQPNEKHNHSHHKPRAKTDKEIYLEAIYREDIAGQIFMKYLLNKNKVFAVNRLKCLQELIKYKDLFYDENFNQEAVKRYALVRNAFYLIDILKILA